MSHPLDTDTLKRWIRQSRDFVLIDTLPGSIFAKGHLPGAVNLPSDNILDLAPGRFPDKDVTLVVYCASETCKRAGLSAERLKRLGYRHIYHYEGGKKAWLAEGLSLQTDHS